MLHSCSGYCRHDPAVARVPAGRSLPLTVDLHCHILVPEVEGAVAGRPEKKAELELTPKAIGADAHRHNMDVMLPPAIRRLMTLSQRLSDMDNMGVDVQVLSPSPTQYYYWADREMGEQLARMQNEHIARKCAEHPDRLRAMGTVSLQHPDLAAAQLAACVNELGMVGVEISTTVNGKDVSDPMFDVFWRQADDLGCVVFIHPLGTSLGERVDTHYLSNIIGQPLETTIALSKLILDGVLDRYVRLKIVAAHGGGYLPSYIGRLEHGAAVRPEAALAKPAVEYLKQIWFDSVVYDPEVLRHMIKTVGASQIVVGTDYPFDMGTYDVHDFVNSVEGLSREEREAILGGNAAKLIGLR